MAPMPLEVSISIKKDSQDANCKPLSDNLYKSKTDNQGELDTSSGIGAIVAPMDKNYAFTLHDHRYSSTNIPDPSRAMVTFQFNTAVTIDSVLILQHTNGITWIEGFAGDDENQLHSIGTTWGPSGDNIQSGGLPEAGLQLFQFDNSKTQLGRIFRVVFRKTNLLNGWATYRVIPITTYVH